MAKYRKKPVVIEAEQWFPGQAVRGVCACTARSGPHLHTIHEGQSVELAPGDYVIPESDGEHFYPCKPDIFEKTYEPVP
jgi:hypothetical protein